MGGLWHLIVFLSVFSTITLKSNSQFILPIHKDESTNQYFTTIVIEKTPVNLLLDLGTNLTWLNCRKLKSLSSLRIATCQSSTCKSIPGTSCDVGGKTCLYQQPNPFGPKVTSRVVQDKALIYRTYGRVFDNAVSHPFTFSCAGQQSLRGLASTIAGVMSLAPGRSSYPEQVTSAFNVIPKFALCLPSYRTGHFYIAGVHYVIPPFDNSTNPLPLTVTPMRIDSGDYLITVNSIYVDGSPLSLNSDLLSGGAKLSTVVQYTLLKSDIYNALAHSFTLKAKSMGISQVSPIAPFKHCFDARNAGNKLTGPNVPVIDFGLPGRAGEVRWRFFGDNTIAKVSKTVMCLAFQDGGQKQKEMMVIGTHQIRNYMLEFDFSRTMFSFSDSLLLHNTSCSTWDV